MKKLLLLGLAIMIVASTLMLQGCNNEAQTTTATPVATVPTVDSISIQSSPATVPVTTIGWGALTPAQREEVVQIGNNHPFGGTVNLNPKMDEIVSVLFIEDIPSNCQKQTLLEYKYSNGVQVGTNKILIKGHLENIKKAESIPDLLNNGSCCFEYGGCIKAYECNEPLPEPQNCAPCKKVQQTKEDCKSCKPGPGKRQGDGAVTATNANGNNRKIVTNW